MEVVDSRLTQKKFLSLVTYISVMKISFFYRETYFSEHNLNNQRSSFFKSYVGKQWAKDQTEKEKTVWYELYPAETPGLHGETSKWSSFLFAPVRNGIDQHPTGYQAKTFFVNHEYRTNIRRGKKYAL